jgi:hypothetical protein
VFPFPTAMSTPTNSQPSSTSGSVAASTVVLLKPTGANIDIPRQWKSLKDKNDKMVTCDFCKKTST